MLSLMLLVAFYLFLFLVAKPIQASQVLMTDNFDDGDFSDWTVMRNSQHHHPQEPCFDGGEPAVWKIAEGRLGITINGSPCTTEIVPHNLDLAEVDDYEFEFEWSFPVSTHMDRNVLIKWQDAENWYGLHIVDDKLIIQKVIAGQLASVYNNWGYYQFAADQSYQFKISVVNDLITIGVDDQQIIQVIDRPPFINGYQTIGLQASSGSIFKSSSWFDNLVVTSLDQVGQKKLGVPLYKQHDSSWKNVEYDRAQEWAETITIARWGCALTSATMILDYYHIEQLPTGKKLDPAKLNAWLKNEPDGFIGEGLVNWLAISRLTRMMSDELETPVLEYQWLGKEIEQAITKIDQDQPVILQLPGHFLVADGYNALQTDLFIKDPAYNYQLLSQHQTELSSVRSFKPSQTDLSYLLIVHDPETKVTLIDESGHLPAELKIYSEYIDDFESEEQTKISIIQSLAKPAQGNYLLKIANDENRKVEIYTYNTEGEVTVLTQEIMGTKLFNLNFDPHEISELIEITNQFTLLRDLLKTLYEAREITTKYAYLKLDQLAAYAEQDEENQERYRKLIIKTAEELKEFVPYLTVIRTLAPSS